VTTASHVVEAVKTEQTTQVQTSIDTTKKDENTIQVVEVQYYPPMEKGDSLVTPFAKATIADKSFIGNIKSIKTTTITKNTEVKGITKTDSTLFNKTARATDSNTNTVTDVAKDPKRFMWIFFIVFTVVAVGVFVWSQIKGLNPIEYIKGLFK
jgi:uncharacterized membrane protein